MNEETKIIDTLDQVKELSENLNKEQKKTNPILLILMIVTIVPLILKLVFGGNKAEAEQPIDLKADKSFQSKAAKIAALNKKLGVHLFLDTGLVAGKKQMISDTKVTMAFVGKSIKTLENKLIAEKINYKVLATDKVNSIVEFTYEGFEFEIIILTDNDKTLTTKFSLPIDGVLKTIDLDIQKYDIVDVEVHGEKLKTWDVHTIEKQIGEEFVNIQQYYDFLKEKNRLKISDLETLGVTEVEVTKGK